MQVLTLWEEKKGTYELFVSIYVYRLEIRQSTIYYAGLLERWDKRIVDQD